MSSNLHVPDLIIKKRDKKALSREEIEFFIEGVVKKTVQESQIGAMLMAIYLNDLNGDEITHLTRAMMNSGPTLQWREEWKGLMVDKHSTGGVGDKVSLILAPALAACGMKVPMISGRGLEHTGGTLDKLEAIPGFQVSVTSEKMVDILDKVGCCIVGQTGKLCPADGILYATRDVTGTVKQDGLIVGSIISKKAAENLDALILDVKFGIGAFYKEIDGATHLAKLMVKAGNGLGIKTMALLTDMNSPLGYMIGNGLEVVEAIACLHGDGPRDLVDLVTQLGGNLLHIAGKATSSSEGCQKITETLQNGSALKTFCSMMKAQGVESQTAEDLCAPGVDLKEKLAPAKHKEELVCSSSGYVTGIDAMSCAVVAQKIGAGRQKAGEAIDYSVGLELLVDIGTKVEKGTPWMRVYRTNDFPQNLKSMLEQAIKIGNEAPDVMTSRVQDVVI